MRVTDYWMNPVPDAPLTLQLTGGIPGGTLMADPQSSAGQDNVSLTTDSQGLAEVYFQWQGGVDRKEALQEVVITEGATQVQAQKQIHVYGLDLAVAGIQEAGFTGVTGQQAFFKIYFKDLAHPDLPLARFNAESPNQLGLRVTIRQYHADGVNKSLTFEQTGSWGQDERGTFVEMDGTPRMPAVVPRNDGTSWYKVQVDPVVDEDVFLPDLFRANNSTIFAVTTGSPKGWLHLWLQDGVLTPHSYTGVIFKCVGRFLPGLGEAMTVIDPLNQVYKQDALGLGQSTSAVITEALQKKSSSQALTKYQAGTINNVISCLQDTYGVYQQGDQGASVGDGRCAPLIPHPGRTPRFSSPAGEHDPEMAASVDRFVQGILLDTPDQLGLVVYGLHHSEVTVLGPSGRKFDDPDRTAVSPGVAVYLLPGEQEYALSIKGQEPFDIGLYTPCGDESQRVTIRHEVKPQGPLQAHMVIGGDADQTLEIDRDCYPFLLPS